MMRKIGFESSLPEQGYRLVTQPIIKPNYLHIFCGLPTSTGAVSPFTGKILLRFISLDTLDPRLDIQSIGLPRIELLYSWTCKISEDIFIYKVFNDKINILSPTNNHFYEESYVDFPYPDYPDSFPPVEIDLIEVDDRERQIVSLINTCQDLDCEYPNLSKPYHQIGGQPYFVQKPEVVQCPECGNFMSFFATIGNYNGYDKGFCNNDYVQVVYQICKKCVILAAYNICD